MIYNGRVEESSTLAHHSHSSGQAIFVVMEGEILIGTVCGY